MHDDANELADKKCRFIWANAEYDKIHEELLQNMRRTGGSEADSLSGGKGISISQERDEKEKGLSDKLETLREEIKDLNSDIDRLDEQFYKKYNDKEMAELSNDVRALVAKCKP